MTPRGVAFASAVCTAVLSAGCASADVAQPPAPSVEEEERPTTTDTGDAPSAAAAAMDDHIAWLIEVLEAGEFDATEVTERFDPAFLVQAPVAALNAPMSQIAPPGSAPWQVVEDTRDDQFAEITFESADGSRVTITMALTASEPHRIEGLFLQPAAAELPEGYTLARLDTDMAALASRAGLGIYDVTNGRCDAIHETNGDQPLAIGSIFKLWVLAELANQIEAGTASWNEPLPVRAALRSNPAGQVFQLADGDTLTVREHAEAMISISDNTATDHLIDRLGRPSIEAAMESAGVAQPSLNQPFLATREIFWLKYLAEAPNPPDWYDADTSGRRVILDSLDGKTVPWVLDPALATAPNADGLAQDQPRNLDIEWFASPIDLCRTLVHLDDLASRPGLEPVADILSMNPGAMLDTGEWTDIRHKGGSEPGVTAFAWWLERDDEERYVVVGLFNDPALAFSQFEANELLTYAIDLI